MNTSEIAAIISGTTSLIVALINLITSIRGGQRPVPRAPFEARGTAMRTRARRRSGRYTAAELARLDDPGLAMATARMLRRDG